LRAMFALGLTAIAEQPTFIAMILYRVKKSWSFYPLLIAAAWTFISKLVLVIWATVIIALGPDIFWLRPRRV